MSWFSKRKALQPLTSSPAPRGPRAKGHSSNQDNPVLYSMGTVVSLKPSEGFDISTEKEGYFLITKGNASLKINGAVDVKLIGEGQWLSAIMLPKSGKYYLSLKGGQGLKLIHIPVASADGIDTGTKSQMERSIEELAEYINKSISSMEAAEQSIGEYVRSYLMQENKSILKRYDGSVFIKKAIDEISRLPSAAQRIVGLTLSESVSNAEVTSYIKNDPSLASEVLKVVNSSYHGLRNKVQDLSYAVLYLGLSQIFQIVISASLQNLALGSSKLSSIHEHSIIISNLAGLLSSRRERNISPVLSTVGILHDVGEIVKFHMKEKRKDLDFLIDQMSGAKLGSMLLGKWGIPEPICRAIEIHDQSYYTLPEEFEEDVRLYVACLHVGHSICSFIGDRGLTTDPVTQAYLSYLGFEDTSIERFVKRRIVPALMSCVNKLPIEVQVFFSV